MAETFEVVVIGAGAAGMFCAAQAGRRVLLLLDNGKKPGRKILMSGGGRCNFTNLYIEPAAYLSQNPHFCKSALVPVTLHKPLLDPLAALAGVAVPAVVSAEDGTRFRENILFTHRGLSGPAILQISSFWQTGEFLTLDLLPEAALSSFLSEETAAHPNQSLKNTLAKLLPRRLVECWHQLHDIPDISLKQLTPRLTAQWVLPLQQ